MAESNGINNTIYDAVSNALENKINNCITLLPSTTGKSTYDLAVDYGYIGTERDWLSSIANDTTVVSNLYADAHSISEFVFKPADFKVTRRLAPPINTLQFYIDSIDDYVATIPGIVNDAINNTAVEGGVLADTFVTATVNVAGSVARTQRDKNNDMLSIKDFANVVDAQAAAISQGIKIFIPSGEHEYNLTNADMTLFWGYGQLKDTVTGAIYKPKNGDFVTPEMFGIQEKVDETVKLSEMIRYAAKNNLTVLWQGGKEYWYTRIAVEGDRLGFKWRINGGGQVVLRSIRDSSEFLTNWNLEGSIHLGGLDYSDTIPLTKSAKYGNDVIDVTTTDGLEVGDLIAVRSRRLMNSWARGSDKEGQLHVIDRILPNNKLILKVPMSTTVRVVDERSYTVGEVISPNSILIPDMGLGQDARRTSYIITTSTGEWEVYFDKWSNGSKRAVWKGIALHSLQVGDTVQPNERGYLQVFKPSSVDIKGNFLITKAPRFDATAGDQGSRGLLIRNTTNPIIDGVRVENFEECGLQVRNSYNVKILNCVVDRANRSYNSWDGTGYGIQTYSCSFVEISKCTTTRCRNGIDVAGSPFSSWYTNIVDCVSIGGGATYTGAPFMPVGIHWCGGFGTHGGAVHTNYTNCITVDMANSITPRGINETIINCRHNGFAEHIVKSGGASNITVDGFIYDDGNSTTNSNTKPYMYDNDYHARAFYRHEAGFESDNGYPLNIKNVTCKSLTHCFIECISAGTLPEINLLNNTIYIANSKNDDDITEFDLIYSDSATPRRIKALNDLGGNNVFKGNSGRLTLNYLKNLDFDGTGYFYRAGTTDTYLFSLENDTAIIIPLSFRAAGAVVSLIPNIRGKAFRMENAHLYYNSDLDESLFAETNKSGVEISTNILNGTTGNPKVVTVSYTPTGSNSRIYVENRTEHSQVYTLQVQPLTTLA